MKTFVRTIILTNASERKARHGARRNTQIRDCFYSTLFGELPGYFCIGAMVLALAANLASAQETINLTSGTDGSYMSDQSYNETRAADVTVLSGTDLLVESMTLTGFYFNNWVTSAVVGARIYNTSTQQLIASANVTDSSGGPVTVPISATLVPGGDYRVGFFAATTPANGGIGTFFLPAGENPWLIPYTEADGLLQINGAYDIQPDSFPANLSEAVPQVNLQVVVVPEPACMGLLAVGVTALLFRRHPKPATHKYGNDFATGSTKSAWTHAE